MAWWFVRVVSGRAEANERRLFWTLAFFSFVPVLVVIPVGWLLNDSFWWDRYFIFVAPFYLALVAASVYRLRPEALRAAYAGLLVALAVAASFSDLSTERIAWTGPQVGSRVDWEGAAEALETATPSEVTSVDIYSIPVWSVDHMAGLWAIDMSIPFYLAPEDRERFKLHNAWSFEELFGEPRGPEFWVATYDLLGESRPFPEDDMRALGYVIVESLRFGQPGRAFLLSHVVSGDGASAEAAWGRPGSNCPMGDSANQ